MEHLFAEFYKALIYAVAAFLALYVFIHQTYANEDLKDIIDSHYRNVSNYYRPDATDKDINIYLKGYASKGSIVNIKDDFDQDYSFLTLDCRGTEATLLLLAMPRVELNIANIYSVKNTGDYGISYEGSGFQNELDTLFNYLPDDIKEASQERNFSQNLYSVSYSEEGSIGTGINIYSGGETYTYYDFLSLDNPKLNVRPLCLEDLQNFFKSNSIPTEGVKKYFFSDKYFGGGSIWLGDTIYQHSNALCINNRGEVEIKDSVYDSASMLPVIVVDLSQIDNFEIINIE